MTRERGNSREPKKSRIPEFASREEEASFWDTHDITEYLDEMKPVKVRFAKNLSEGITIRLDKATVAELRARARGKGIGPTTLARMWILEHLQEIKEQEERRSHTA